MDLGRTKRQKEDIDEEFNNARKLVMNNIRNQIKAFDDKIEPSKPKDLSFLSNIDRLIDIFSKYITEALPNAIKFTGIIKNGYYGENAPAQGQLGKRQIPRDLQGAFYYITVFGKDLIAYNEIIREYRRQDINDNLRFEIKSKLTSLLPKIQEYLNYLIQLFDYLIGGDDKNSTTDALLLLRPISFYYFVYNSINKGSFENATVNTLQLSSQEFINSYDEASKNRINAILQNNVIDNKIEKIEQKGINQTRVTGPYLPPQLPVNINFTKEDLKILNSYEGLDEGTSISARQKFDYDNLNLKTGERLLTKARKTLLFLKYDILTKDLDTLNNKEVEETKQALFDLNQILLSFTDDNQSGYEDIISRPISEANRDNITDFINEFEDVIFNVSRVNNLENLTKKQYFDYLGKLTKNIIDEMKNIQEEALSKEDIQNKVAEANEPVEEQQQQQLRQNQFANLPMIEQEQPQQNQQLQNQQQEPQFFDAEGDGRRRFQMFRPIQTINRDYDRFRF